MAAQRTIEIAGAEARSKGLRVDAMRLPESHRHRVGRMEYESPDAADANLQYHMQRLASSTPLTIGIFSNSRRMGKAFSTLVNAAIKVKFHAKVWRRDRLHCL